jgi:hypothetical protein
MLGGGRAMPLIATLILLAVAYLGFLSGHSPVEHIEGTHEAATVVGSLEYPAASGWRPAGGSRAIGDLSITMASVLAPAGNSARAGLIVGRLASSSNPLPPAFLAGLRELPSTGVVYLLNTQAYRYSLSVPGYDEPVTLYMIPHATTGETAIVCYDSTGPPAYMRQCEHIAATFNDASNASVDLAPNAAYAGRIRAAVERLDEVRVALRSGIRPRAPGAGVSQLAARLAADVTSIANSVAAVQPPLPVEMTHATFVQSLLRASKAYSALAAAVGSGSAIQYSAARAQVDDAEARVAAALEDFTLLGYNKTTPSSPG